MKSNIITISSSCAIFFIFLFMVTPKTQSQTVSTFIEQFPGDGEMSFDDDGFIYINESEVNGSLVGDAVWKVDPQNGNFSEFRGNLPIWVVGSAFDLNENLLVTGWSAGIITKISADGSTAEPFANNINGAGSLEIDENGNVYVAEFLDNDVLKYDSDMNLIETFASSVNIESPAGLAYLESTGELYVSNWEDGKISIIDSNGNISNFSQVPSLNGGPIKIFGDYLYLTSPLRHIIYRIPLNDPADVQEFSGTIDLPGHTDGSIETATYDTPTGIGSMDGGNTIYITEKFNGAGRLRIIENVLGIESIDKNAASAILFPNPSTDKLIIGNLQSETKNIKVTVYDIRGRKIQLPQSIYLSGKIELNISGISSGTYFIKLFNNKSNGVATYSFLKK